MLIAMLQEPRAKRLSPPPPPPTERATARTGHTSTARNWLTGYRTSSLGRTFVLGTQLGTIGFGCGATITGDSMTVSLTQDLPLRRAGKRDSLARGSGCAGQERESG